MNPNMISVVSSPLTLFALVVLVCNAVIAVCATKFKNEEIFKYTIHMFLGIIFFIGSIVLWSPGYLYNPVEIKDLDLPRNPWVPTIATFLGVLIYMAYHGWKYAKELKSSVQNQTKKDG